MLMKYWAPYVEVLKEWTRRGFVDEKELELLGCHSSSQTKSVCLSVITIYQENNMLH